MSLNKHIENLRNKPRHVRERMLLLAMIVIAPTLFISWVVTFHTLSGPSSVTGLANMASDIFQSGQSVMVAPPGQAPFDAGLDQQNTASMSSGADASTDTTDVTIPQSDDNTTLYTQ